MLHFGVSFWASRLTQEQLKANERVAVQDNLTSRVLVYKNRYFFREDLYHTRSINALFLLVFIFKTKYPTFQSGAAPDAANLGREHRGLRVLHGRQRRASYSNLRLLGRHSVSQR